MAKVFLGVGHGGSDPGAVKYLREEDVNLNMALGCGEYLTSKGIDVQLSRTRDENDTLEEEIRECNKYNPDLAVDIHNNAGGGDGFEAYYHHLGGNSIKLAKNIEKEVKAIGQNSRGCKTKLNKYGKDYYGFIRQTKAPAVITEGVFVDNKTDVKIVDTVEKQKAFGVAIAKGIIATLKEMGKYNESNPVEQVNELYKVKINTKSLNVRSAPKVTRPSSKNVVTTVKKGEVYTIVEEKNGWGKLKSGVGWIKLSYTVKI